MTQIAPQSNDRIGRLTSMRTLVHREDQNLCVLKLTDHIGTENIFWLKRADLLAIGKQMIADATLLDADRGASAPS